MRHATLHDRRNRLVRLRTQLSARPGTDESVCATDGNARHIAASALGSGGRAHCACVQDIAVSTVLQHMVPTVSSSHDRTGYNIHRVHIVDVPAFRWGHESKTAHRCSSTVGS